VIDSKINIRSKPVLSAQPESLVNNNAGIALADRAVQTRAYELLRTSWQNRWPCRAGLVPSRNRPWEPAAKKCRGHKMYAAI